MKSRNELGTLLNELGLFGNAVEIGVDQGCYAGEILRRWKGRLYFMVDPWQRYPEYNDLFERDQPIMDAIYKNVVEGCRKDPRIVILRGFSVPVGKLFHDGYFDFAYIDADHTYKSANEDINTWWSKIKSGGILAGHDYKEGMGVIQAVDEFVKENNLTLNLTEEDYASWWIIKP